MKEVRHERKSVKAEEEHGLNKRRNLQDKLEVMFENFDVFIIEVVR